MKKKYLVSRWIFLVLSLVMNTFLVLYSVLPRTITIQWTNFVTNIFTSIINSITEKKVETINITNLDIFLSSEESYKYNYIPGYQANEIPLGSAKQIEFSYLPENATDKSITYYTDNNDIVALNQSGGVLSVVGMKEGTVTIYGENKATGLKSSCEVTVVNTVEPQMYEIEVDNNVIPLGSQETIKFNIDGGNLGHDELVNYRYYDTRNLTYIVEEEYDVIDVDEYGVIYPKSIGSARVFVENTVGVSKTIDITVIDGDITPNYENLHIEGSSFCYENDMILDQSSKSNHYQMDIYNGEEKLNSEDFIWKSSNELLVKVDNKGIMRGFRKLTPQDEIVTITAVSKLTLQEVAYDVVVKEQLPTSMYYWINNEGKETWNPTSYTACVGDNLTLNIGYNLSIYHKEVNITFSDESIIEYTNQGSSIYLHPVKEGTTTIFIESIVNPSLKHKIELTVLKAGAIDTNDIDDVGTSIRKIVGHASLFAVAEVFTIIAIYMFIYDKKYYFALIISLTAELLLSSISETVQYFTPGRHGTFTDVMINFGGAVIGALLVVIPFIICKVVKSKKKS